MPNYRRAFVPGGCWFFTATLLDRRSRLLVERVDALREATRRTRERFPFHIDAFVVLPDHIHAIWPYSSFHRDVKDGIFPEDWAGEVDPAGDFGERP